MSNLKALFNSTESIDFQKNHLLRIELTEAFKSLAKIKTPTVEDFLTARIPEIIAHHTGINVSVSSDCVSLQCAILPPALDKNHVLINAKRSSNLRNGDALVNIKKSGDVIEGAVDLVTGKVSGVYTKIPCILFLGWRIAGSNSIITPEEQAAVTMHEIGHVITYYIMLGRLVRTNVIMAVASDAMLRTEDTVVRVKILSQVEETLGAKFTDKKALVNSRSKLGYRTIIFSKAREAAISETGIDWFENSAWEAMSDQYAVRQGTAKDLVCALAKIHRFSGSMETVPAYVKYALDLFNVVGLILEIIIGAWFTAAFLMFLFYTQRNGTYTSGYDPLDVRMKRIENDLVANLKVKDLGKAQRIKVISDLAAIRAVSKDIKSIDTIWNILVNNVYLPRSRAISAQKLQSKIEDLTANDLFVSSAKLKTL